MEVQCKGVVGIGPTVQNVKKNPGSFHSSSALLRGLDFHLFFGFKMAATIPVMLSKFKAKKKVENGKGSTN